MNSQAQSTNNSILQLPMQSLSDWASDLVQNDRKQELINLLVALPIIRELTDKGFGDSLLNISEDEVKILYEIASVDASGIDKAKRQSMLFAFEQKLKLQIQTLDQAFLARRGPNKMKHMEKMANALYAFQRSSGKMFLEYLKKSGATNEQCTAHQLCASFQKRATKDYIRQESFILNCFAQGFEQEGHVSRPKQPSKSDEKGINKRKSRGSIPKKETKQERLKTERSVPKPQKQQKKAMPKKRD